MKLRQGKGCPLSINFVEILQFTTGKEHRVTEDKLEYVDTSKITERWFLRFLKGGTLRRREFLRLEFLIKNIRQVALVNFDTLNFLLVGVRSIDVIHQMLPYALEQLSTGPLTN